MSYYDKQAPTCVVSVLGTEYKIYTDVPESEDETLQQYGGYCDKTSHLIAVAGKNEEANLHDWDAYVKQVMRHEIVHAFLFESGLGGDSVWYVEGQEHPEQTVDWIARQFPKILEAFRAADAL